MSGLQFQKLGIREVFHNVFCCKNLNCGLGEDVLKQTAEHVSALGCIGLQAGSLSTLQVVGLIFFRIDV